MNWVTTASGEAPAVDWSPDQLNECRRTLCGSRLRCFFRDRIVSVSLDDIGGARTAIDERAHVGPAVRDSPNECGVSLTICQRRNLQALRSA
jgi:hypothetical protein